MITDIISAGQVVELQSANVSIKRSAEDDKVYRTKIFDVISEDRLEIIMPMEKTKLILLPIDGEYNLCFYADSGLFQCYAKVIDRYKSNNVYIIVMELSSNLRKYQRREYYRFSCALEMSSRKLELEEIQAVEQNEVRLVPGLPLKRSVIVDISGGGLRFVANHEYDTDSLIYVTYNLLVKGTVKSYHLVGKVLGTKELENKPGVFEHRLKFINLDVDEREEIIRYIFDEERKKRHKETGR